MAVVSKNYKKATQERAEQIAKAKAILDERFQYVLENSDVVRRMRERQKEST